MVSCYYPSEGTGEILCSKRQSKEDLRHESNVAERQWDPQIFSSQLTSLDGTVLTEFIPRLNNKKIQVEVFRVRN